MKILFCSDIHGDLESLEKVLQRADAENAEKIVMCCFATQFARNLTAKLIKKFLVLFSKRTRGPFCQHRIQLFFQGNQIGFEDGGMPGVLDTKSGADVLRHPFRVFGREPDVRVFFMMVGFMVIFLVTVVVRMTAFE